MSESTTGHGEGHLVFDHPSVNSESGSINAEPVEVAFQDSGSNRATSLRLTPEQVAEQKKKCCKLEVEKYFALKAGYFDRAVEQCKNELYVTEVDGNFIGAWLVTEIDHWDNEKERVVLLTEKQLIVVQFNFINSKIDDHRKIPLVNCTRIQTSRFEYTSSTFAFYRQSNHRCDQFGLRIYWNALRVPGTLDFWNPWSREIPFLTLTSHMSVEVNEDSPECVNFAAFQKSLVAAASSDLSRALVTDEQPIFIHTILGVSAVVHNQSKLGFSRDRGGVCF